MFNSVVCSRVSEMLCRYHAFVCVLGTLYEYSDGHILLHNLIIILQALGLRFSYDGRDFAQLKTINRLFNHSFGPGNSRILDQFSIFNFLREEYKALIAAMELRNTFWSKHARSVEV